MTKRERARVEALRLIGCIACRHIGVRAPGPTELHHMLSGGKRMGHWYTLVLCEPHHQGKQGWPANIPPVYRVSIASGSKVWNLVYPTQRELWEHAQWMIGEPALWPVSKILPRRINNAAPPSTTPEPRYDD
jgi:hypothetical protein